MMGDATVLMALQALVKGYSPDLAKPLDACLGRETGQRTAALVELAMATLGELLASTRVQAHQATETYFTERYTTREQSESLAGRLDRLRLHIDRLEAKVNRHWQQDIPQPPVLPLPVLSFATQNLKLVPGFKELIIFLLFEILGLSNMDT